MREKKKEATRQALREAALRLALERGPDNVRVDDIADAAGVSTRTYNNYFSSREQAIVAAVTAEREARVAAAVAARPATVRLSDAVVGAIVEQYTDPGSHDPRALLLITTRPALRDAFLGTAAGIEDPLTAVIAERIGDNGQLTARVLVGERRRRGPRRTRAMGTACHRAAPGQRTRRAVRLTARTAADRARATGARARRRGRATPRSGSPAGSVEPFLTAYEVSSPRAVGASDDLEEMPVGVTKVHAATTIAVVDLPLGAESGVRPVVLPECFDAGEDLVALVSATKNA